MKVLILNQIPEVNNKYTFSLARGLKRANVDVRICGIESDDVSAYSDVEYLRLFGAYSKESNLLKKVKIYKNSWDRIIEYCINEKIEIVHVQWYIFSPLDWYYHQKIRKNGIKVITTIHDLLPFDRKVYDYYFHKKIYSHSDKVISQAKMNIDELVEKYNVERNKIVYIPHGHYMEYAETATKEESLEHLSLPKSRPIVLFFGQIKKVKGVDVLIEAIGKVKKKYPNIFCVIAGKVWKDDFSIYENMIDELNLSDCIRTDIKFIPDNDIKYYFNAADIVALPYRQIYQSGVVLLGAAYEKPIVATTEGEFLNVIKNGETGLLVESGNSTEFANALIKLLDDRVLATKLGQACKEDLSRRLNWTNIAMNVAREYESVLKTENNIRKHSFKEN